MAHPTTLLMAATLAITGSVLGVHLGRSAIAEIDPVYFSTNGVRFFADLVPGGYQPSASRPADLEDFWANDLPASPRSRCDECGSFVEPAPFLSAADYPPLEIGTYVETVALPEPAPGNERRLMPEEVERYAYFPVTQEEAERQRNRWDSSDVSYAGRSGPSKQDLQAREAAPIGM